MLNCEVYFVHAKRHHVWLVFDSFISYDSLLGSVWYNCSVMSKFIRGIHSLLCYVRVIRIISLLQVKKNLLSNNDSENLKVVHFYLQRFVLSKTTTFGKIAHILLCNFHVTVYCTILTYMWSIFFRIVSIGQVTYLQCQAFKMNILIATSTFKANKVANNGNRLLNSIAINTLKK